MIILSLLQDGSTAVEARARSDGVVAISSNAGAQGQLGRTVVWISAIGTGLRNGNNSRIAIYDVLASFTG